MKFFYNEVSHMPTQNNVNYENNDVLDELKRQIKDQSLSEELDEICKVVFIIKEQREQIEWLLDIRRLDNMSPYNVGLFESYTPYKGEIWGYPKGCFQNFSDTPQMRELWQKQSQLKTSVSKLTQ